MDRPQPPPDAGPAPARGVESWSDAAKVVLVSALTLPFALGWVVRSLQVLADPVPSPYVSRDFLPSFMPVLWAQLGGHLALIVAGLLVRRRNRGRAPWLVHLEIQLWCVCLTLSSYAVGTLTSPFAVMLLVLPVIGYLLFEPRPVHYGMATLTIGTLAGIALPQLGVLPYAPFLAEPPFIDHRLHPAWLVAFGVPSIFATTVGAIILVRLVHRLRERQAELERLTSTDALTGLANRTAFFRRLEQEIARSRRHQLPLCLLMIDVDHFKVINDTRGHLVGDAVLRQLGDRLRESLRTGDVAARFGGEELVVLLPHTGPADAVVVGERLLRTARAIGAGAELPPVTVSIGAAALAPTDDGDALIARADAALYESKRAGRDRLTVA